MNLRHTFIFLYNQHSQNNVNRKQCNWDSESTNSAKLGKSVFSDI